MTDPLRTEALPNRGERLILPGESEGAKLPLPSVDAGGAGEVPQPKGVVRVHRDPGRSRRRCHLATPRGGFPHLLRLRAESAL